MKIDNYIKITEWIDSSIGQSTVVQELDKKGQNYSIQTKSKTVGSTLILKMALVSFVV